MGSLLLPRRKEKSGAKTEIGKRAGVKTGVLTKSLKCEILQEQGGILTTRWVSEDWGGKYGAAGRLKRRHLK